MSIHRKIYEQNYGPIPKGYHVHHKDMNHKNKMAPEHRAARSARQLGKKRGPYKKRAQ